MHFSPILLMILKNWEFKFQLDYSQIVDQKTTIKKRELHRLVRDILYYKWYLKQTSESSKWIFESLTTFIQRVQNLFKKVWFFVFLPYVWAILIKSNRYYKHGCTTKECIYRSKVICTPFSIQCFDLTILGQLYRIISCMCILDKI